MRTYGIKILTKQVHQQWTVPTPTSLTGLLRYEHGLNCFDCLPDQCSLLSETGQEESSTQLRNLAGSDSFRYGRCPGERDGVLNRGKWSVGWWMRGQFLSPICRTKTPGACGVVGAVRSMSAQTSNGYGRIAARNLRCSLDFLFGASDDKVAREWEVTDVLLCVFVDGRRRSERTALGPSQQCCTFEQEKSVLLVARCIHQAGESHNREAWMDLPHVGDM